MSDLKLYEGINHIDDDLIDEANAPARRPKYYTFALSAAAVLLVIGVSGIALGRNGSYSPRRYTDVETSSAATTESTATTASPQISTTTRAGTTASVTSDIVKGTSLTTTADNKDSYSPAETSVRPETNDAAAYERSDTAAYNTSAAVTASILPQTAAAVTTVNTTTTQTVTTKVYDDERSKDMKKAISLLSSAVMLSPIAAKTAYSTDLGYKDPAERYGLGGTHYSEEIFEIGPAEQELFDRIDQGIIDIDIDRNGELDMRDTALLYFYETRRYLADNPDDTQFAELYRESILNYDLNELPEETREFLENREDIRNKELFAKSKNYWPYKVAMLDSKLLTRYHLTHTLKPEYFTKEYYSDVDVYEALTNSRELFTFDQFFYYVGGQRNDILNQMRGAFGTELDPLYDLNGDGVFDLHDVQDYVEYQFGYKVSEDEYESIINADHIDMTAYREYPNSKDSITEEIFRNCVKLENANIEFEKKYSFDNQIKENAESIVRIGFQRMIELYFMKNDFKLIYATPEYYTDNRPGCDGLPLYDRIDLYSFVKQYAGSHGYTTTKISFNENTFNLFYEKWAADVKNGDAAILDVNGSGSIDKGDLSYIQQYEKEIWAKTSAKDSKLPKDIRKLLDEDFDLNGNDISGDLYDIMAAQLYIRSNYPEAAPDIESTEAASALTFTYPKGDANCDGKVSLSDAVAILQYIANRDKYDLKPQGKENADVNGDGAVTALDSLEIQKMDAEGSPLGQFRGLPNT